MMKYCRRSEGALLHEERWILAEWFGVAFRVMSPPWGFVILVGDTQGCVAVLLTLGFISVPPWGSGAFGSVVGRT